MTLERLKRELAGAFPEKECELFKELECCGLVDGYTFNVPPPHDDEVGGYLSTLLRNVSALAARKDIAFNEDILSKLVDYIAPTVNVYKLIDYTWLATEYLLIGDETVPNTILAAIISEEFDEDIVEAIGKLERHHLYDLFSYVYNEVEAIEYEYAAAIVKLIYKKGLLSHELFFMAAAMFQCSGPAEELEDPAEENTFNFVNPDFDSDFDSDPFYGSPTTP